MLRRFQPGLLRDDSRDQAEVAGLFRTEQTAAQNHVHCHRLADRTRKPLRATGAGHDAEVDLGLAELGGF